MQVLGVYALIYIKRGTGVFTNATGFASTFEPGDVFLLFPELGHRYGATTDAGMEEIFITFQGPIFDLWKRSGLLNPKQPQFHLEPVSFWLEKLLEVIDTTPHDATETLRPVTRLCNLLGEMLITASTKREDNDSAPWLSTARAALGTNLHQPLSVQDIAQQIGIPYDSFRHQFRQLTGLSPGRYRLNQRIAAASDLLLHTPLSIRQIAHTLGFNTEFHFSQRFKEAKGVSPRKFREINRRN
jgi:AraC-like DNA-binding protein